MKIYPIVTVLNEDHSKLVSTIITNCDQCGKPLDDFDNFIDDAVRCLYFCSDECRKGFLIQVKTRGGYYPGIKLTLKGVAR